MSELHPNVNRKLSSELQAVASRALYEQERAWAIWKDQGERGPCPYNPECMAGWPLGQMHCPVCGCMAMAGMPHFECEPGIHD